MIKKDRLNKEIKERLRKEYDLPPQSFGDKCADLMASFGGSWYFVIFFASFCAFWIFWNLFGFEFDPYPFIFLNLFLSCLAAIQAPIVLMSQNRMSEIDREREKKAYLIIIKTELELINLNKRIDELTKEIKNGLQNRNSK